MMAATTQEGKLQWISTYPIYACVILTNVPLAKLSHSGKHRIDVGRDYTKGHTYQALRFISTY